MTATFNHTTAYEVIDRVLEFGGKIVKDNREYLLLDASGITVARGESFSEMRERCCSS